jgi:hypothetical protein
VLLSSNEKVIDGRDSGTSKLNVTQRNAGDHAFTRETREEHSACMGSLQWTGPAKGRRGFERALGGPGH